MLLSANAQIYSHDHGYNPRSNPTPLPLIIEHNVWIGLNSIILPQAKSIGEGAIVGAGSIVAKSIPAGAIVAGNPAKIIKYRDNYPIA